jgi:hypothetical protein
MERIQSFLNKLNMDFNMSPKEVNETKEEIRNHLLEFVQEARQRGLSEEQAVSEALEQFGDEQQIKKEFNSSLPKQKKSTLLKISLLFLIAAVIVQIVNFSIMEFHEYERESFLRSTENNLLLTTPLGSYTKQMESEISMAILEGVIKDIAIQEHLSQEYIFRSIDNEGFGQDDSSWIDTVVKERVINGGDKTFQIQYSYNILINTIFASLVLLSGYWIVFAYWFNLSFRDKKWTAIILLTNLLGFLYYKAVHLKSI